MSDRLSDRLAVYDELDDKFEQADAHKWMHRANHRLQNRTPAQAISDGDTSAVLMAVYALGDR